MNRTLLTYLQCISLIILLAACQNKSGKPHYTIGFSQCTSYDAWRDEMENKMRGELAFYDNVDLLFKDAQGNNEVQVAQIKELVEKEVDLLIVSPNEEEPLTPVVEQVFKRGIPVILLDRKTGSNLYSAFVGADNYQIGQMAANYVSNILGGEGKLVEIKGGSTPFIERHRGFINGIKKFPGIKVSSVEGDWGVKRDGEAAFVQLVKGGEHFDMIFAHNDILAISAQRVYAALNRSEPIKILGVDGLDGPEGGLQYVSDGLMDATILYPTGGDRAIQLAMDILNNRPYTKENILKTTVIDQSNVEVMKNYTDEISSLEADINRMGEKITQQLNIFKTQQNLLFAISFLFLVAIILLVFTWKLLVERRRIERSLQRRNQEILRQKDEILTMSEVAEKANKDKLTFFTNISHEFRTPLTLIQTPIDEYLANDEEKISRKEMLLMRKNIGRLMRLINQLMDFRRIDSAKMRLQVGELEVVAFLENIMSAFEPMAKKRDIQFKLLFDERNSSLWFDPNMIDKVMFNLLSNAFKYTKDGGRIIVRVREELLQNSVKISIEDNGEGMTPEDARHIFDRFYQGKGAQSKIGTGLGLALSKELMELHHGTITVSSVPEKGTTFEISMKKGNLHFAENELKEEVFQQDIIEDPSFIYDQPEEEVKEQDNKVQSSITILVIEDDPLLRKYLVRKLSPHYQILESASVEEGSILAKEQIPDLITCDLMLDDGDGFDIIKALKSDIRTSHIPIVVVSAKSSMDDRLEGIKLGIDDYVTKPFSFQFLLERIRMLLINREKLREHFIHQLPVEISPSKDTNLERSFMKRFNALIEEYLSDPDFGAQQLGESMGLSRSQLYRKVKAILGYSVNDYINKVRIKKACQLLLEEDMSISEIAQMVGFSSATYFSTVFKNHLQMRPSEYKEAHKSTG